MLKICFVLRLSCTTAADMQRYISTFSDIHMPVMSVGWLS